MSQILVLFYELYTTLISDNNYWPFNQFVLRLLTDVHKASTKFGDFNAAAI